MSHSTFNHWEKGNIREAYLEFKSAHPGTVDGMAAVKPFKQSSDCQWKGAIKEIYYVSIGHKVN